ncbi:hypothetical protein AB0D49_32840 [Streptomyces sp. NPDC048290]|uniref:hypothetical protein n=1 Tax=Streptomyces sp. NPDC048290 TaxID=3155811 RepID=UPI0034454100
MTHRSETQTWSGTGLPPRVDWHGIERPADDAEVFSAEGIAARVRREAAEMRAAAAELAAGTSDPLDIAVAAFLTTQATLLERAGGDAVRADVIRPEQDTLHSSGTLPTAARSALLIARAHQERAQEDKPTPR